MRIQLNGRPHDLAEGTTVAELIMAVAGTARGRAAVVDGAVVPRSTWPTHRLQGGQSVELITAVPGG